MHRSVRLLLEAGADPNIGCGSGELPRREKKSSEGEKKKSDPRTSDVAVWRAPLDALRVAVRNGEAAPPPPF